MTAVALQPRQCECGKRPYHKKEAQTIANRRTGRHVSARHERGAEYLRIYQCPASNWWHITHKYPR